MRNKKNGSVSGKGYYIALLLCAAAIGISGFLYYRNADKTKDSLQQTIPADAQQDEEDKLPVVSPEPSVDSQQGQQQTPTVSKPDKMKTVAPVEGQTLAVFAMDQLTYNQTTRDWRTHDGVDIAAESGTKVLAAAAGEVYTVYEDDTMGTTVVIRHQNGYTTCYASLSEQVVAEPGMEVAAGDTIGYVGNTALLESALGDHLHFSVSCNGEPVDPAEFLAQE
ncbi:MAG: M23 family metallopeptidase [Oscillospiraceae bacterium]|nr:M23 family metallopeptidase [Oscillospiraceae bacterium]